MAADKEHESTEKIGVYIHFPWCLTKCPYCDFLSVTVPGFAPGAPPNAAQAREVIPHARYADAIIHELELRRAGVFSEAAPSLGSVFFGGGTPSLWDPQELGRVLAAVLRAFPKNEGVEVTVECNPTSVTEDHFRALIDAGVNRVSIGVQAVEKERLSFLGRLHDAPGGLRALDEARRAAVPRVSADLIFGVHKQPPDEAVRDVRQVLDRGVGHMSAYALTIEPNTRFGALNRTGKLPLLDDALVAESFTRVAETAAEYGLEHYEVSNYAKDGQRSVHNLGYWQGRDYLGLGTGAFGTIQLQGQTSRLRYKNLLSPERYLAVYQSAQPGDFDPYVAHLSETEAISSEVSVTEALLLGLRIDEGIDDEQLFRRFGAKLFTPEREPARAQLLAQGRLAEADGRTFVPKAHWLHLDGIVRDLI